MKKYILVLAAIVFSFSACKKSSTTTDATAQAAKDDAAIQAYLKTNNITTAVKDASGLYYQVVTAGTGGYPVATSTVTVNYVGKLLDGTQFDSSTAFSATLSSGVISGWTIGMQHINTGGRIILYVPSALGYGTAASGSIPANAVLIFTIDLLGYKN